MTEYDIDFLMKLKQLCLEFDTKAESYPDPDFVGFALYYYATHPGYDLHCGYGGSIDIQTEFCEGGKEWIAELEKMTYSKRIIDNGESINTSDEHDLVRHVHIQGLKLYHFGDTLYVAKSCEKGREVKNVVEGGQQYRRDESDGYGVKWVPSIKEPHTIYYEDGGVEFVENINLKYTDDALFNEHHEDKKYD